MMDFRQRYTYNTKADWLGAGGFATVYRATDNLLERTVALKFFRNTGEDKYTLINEIRRSIQLENPNICRCYDVVILSGKNIHGDTGQTEVGIMEYMDGGNIKEYLTENKQWLDKLLTDTLKGLAYLHSKKIIHRDIKPGNILIRLPGKEPDGEIDENTAPVAKITDFGISKTLLTTAIPSTQTMGTLVYMAPEQFEPLEYGVNGEIATNADIWSFGVLAYELIMGEMLFDGIGEQTTGQAIVRVLREDYRRKIEAVPDERYKKLLKACLVRKAGDRCSGSELIGLLTERNIGVEVNLDNQRHLKQEKATIPVSQKAEQISNSSLVLFYDEISAFAGYKNSSNEVIVQPKYDYAVEFKGNRALVSVRDKYGFIDKQGQEVISLKYDGAFSFSEGLAPVRLNSRYGFINEAEQEIIPFRYVSADSFSEGLAYVTHDILTFNTKFKKGFIDKIGREIISSKYEFASSFSEGLAQVELKDKHGFIDKTGRVVIPLKYDYASSFSEGLARVSLKGKCGFVNKLGQEIIPLKFDDAGNFSEGFVWVSLNGRQTFIDKSGQELRIVPSEYEEIQPFSEGLAAVRLNRKWGFVDRSGMQIVLPKYDEVRSFHEGMAPVKLNGKRAFINRVGQEITSFKYNVTSWFYEGLACVEMNGKWGFVNKSGQEIIPLKYDDASVFYKGIAKVQVKNEQFYIDKQDNFVKAKTNFN